MEPGNEIIEFIELHAVDEIWRCFSNGLDPNGYFRGKPLIFELPGEYTRSTLLKSV